MGLRFCRKFLSRILVSDSRNPEHGPRFDPARHMPRRHPVRYAAAAAFQESGFRLSNRDRAEGHDTLTGSATGSDPTRPPCRMRQRHVDCSLQYRRGCRGMSQQNDAPCKPRAKADFGPFVEISGIRPAWHALRYPLSGVTRSAQRGQRVARDARPQCRPCRPNAVHGDDRSFSTEYVTSPVKNG